MQVWSPVRVSDMPHAVNCRLSWSQVPSSIQLLVNAAWLRDRRQGIVRLIVTVIDTCNRTGRAEQRLYAYKEEACSKGVSACVLFPQGLGSPLEDEVLYILCYQLASLSGSPACRDGKICARGHRNGRMSE
jgi:hypothetical protein